MYKKLIAFTLVAVMGLQLFPPISVSAEPGAWTRRPIHSGLTVEPMRHAGGFSFNVGFMQPMQGTDDTVRNNSWINNVPFVARPASTVLPTVYDVGIRSATRGELWAANLRQSAIPLNVRRWNNVPASPAGPGFNAVPIPTTFLEPGMLHEIWVDPFWENPRRVPPTFAGGPATVAWDIAPMETPMPGSEPMTTIFLSDVEITNIIATPNQLTVQWQNPTWTSGRPGVAHPANFFDDWVIAWRVATPGPFNLLGVPAPFTGIDNGLRIVPVADLTTAPPIAGRPIFEFTISDLELSPGSSIDLRVEPRRGGQWVRPCGVQPFDPSWGPLERHNIGGTDYRFIAFGNRNGLVANEYRWRTDGVVNPIVVEPRLIGTPFGPDRIMLMWDSLASLVQIVQQEGPGAMELRLYELFSPTDELPRELIVSFTNLAHIANVRTHPVEWGDITHTRFFQLRIYIPGRPEPITSNIAVVPWEGVALYPWRPDIRDTLGLPPIGAMDGMITNIRFLAFSRPPFTVEEQIWVDGLHLTYDPILADFNYWVDRDIIYHIIVSDNREHLEVLRAAGARSATSQSGAALYHTLTWEEVYGVPSAREPNFTWPANITTFFPNGEVDTPVPLQGNTTYYVMIYATWDGLPSEPAVRPVFMPPFEDLEVEPVMLSSPPMRIIWPIEADSLTVGWDVRFLEIEEADFQWPANWAGHPQQARWHGAALLDSEGRVWYGNEALRRDQMGENSILNEIIRREPLDQRAYLMTIPRGDSARINAFTDAMRTPIGAHLDREPEDIELRVTFLDRYRYDFLLVQLDEILDHWIDPNDPVYSLLLDGPNGLFMRFMREIPESRWINDGERVTLPWPPSADGSIMVPFTGAIGTATILPNTRYILFVRTVHPDNDYLTSLLPSYILFTTPDGLPRPPVTPTVPVLWEYPDFVSSTSIGVYWRIIGNAPPNADGIRIPIDMHYEIRWSENIFDHPDGFQGQISWAEIEAALLDWLNPSEVFTRNGHDYIRLLIPNMFPQTLYHVWIRALPPPGPGPLPSPSGWSNPVSIWTRPLEPPPPPGLNRVPPAIFNLVNVTPLSTDLHVLLTRITRDIGPRNDASTGDGTIIPLPPETHRNLFLAHFPDQPPNTIFYVRARTIMSVSRAPIGANVVYSYEIQISLTDTFIDVLTLFVPPLGPYDLRITSAWVQIRVPTGEDPGAWPGLEDPAQFPMPDRDFEITYDPLTQTLHFRFRTNRIGADGLPDQNADYRFIGRLNTERVTLYTVDLSAYQGLPISNRIIEVPVSIMNAFEERSVILSIVTGHLDFSVPPGAFNTAQVRGLSMATRDYFQITVNYNPRHMPTIDVNTSFATIPAQLNVVASANGRRTNITAFDKPVGISLPTDGVQNVGLFRSGEGFVGWQDTRGEFSWTTMSLNTSTYTPMTFAGIARNAPPIVGPGAATQAPAVTQAMQRVLGRLTFTDLIQFDASRVVTVNEFNNVVNAIAHNRTSVTLGAQMSQADITALTRARFYTPAAGFNRAVATETLVRLYELRTRQVLTPITPIASVPGLANAPAALHHNLRKAADIGFITGPFFPNEQLTMGELMIMLDILIMDSGF